LIDEADHWVCDDAPAITLDVPGDGFRVFLYWLNSGEVGFDEERYDSPAKCIKLLCNAYRVGSELGIHAWFQDMVI